MLMSQATIGGMNAKMIVSGYIAPAFMPPSSGVPELVSGSSSGRCPDAICWPARTRSGKF